MTEMDWPDQVYMALKTVGVRHAGYAPDLFKILFLNTFMR